jgi:hypothetical protein
METHNIQRKKLDIISRITSIEDRLILEKIWKLLSSSPKNENSDAKNSALENIKSGIIEMKLVENGKSNARPITDLLNEI